MSAEEHTLPLSKQSPTPTQGSTTPPPSTTPSPKRQRKRAQRNGLKLGDNLSQMHSVIEEKKTILKAQSNQEVQRVYEVNPAITVDQQAFQQALQQFAAQLEEANRMNVASIIREGTHRFEHNKWILTVQGDLQANLIVRETELVPFLRETLQVPELFIEMKVSEDAVAAQDQIPYTDEEKLREMGKRNQVLVRLQEIFKARIIYK